MQIKYRITLAYTIIVTIILLFLCYFIYFFSEQNRVSQFEDRLVRKAQSTADLLWYYKMENNLIKQINRTSPSSLLKKSINVYDTNFNLIFCYYDSPEDSVYITPDILEKGLKAKNYFFNIDSKQAVVTVIKHGGQKNIVVSAAYDGDKVEWLSKLQLILTISFFLSVTIVVITGYIFSLGLVRSISVLTNRINQISSQDFSKRLDSGSGRDELQQLAVTINNLLDRLQSSFDTQRRFIDNASHELSTPLASIGSQIDVSLQRARTPDEYRNTLASVNDDVRRLSTLVKSLLEIAKISGVASGLELLPIRVDEVLMNMPSEMKKIDNRNEVKLIFGDLPDDEDKLLVLGNEVLLHSVFKNIIHNACKYSNNKTAIVTLSFADDIIKVSIEDHGPGIAEEEHERIFQPFYRSSDINDRISGSGLGLALATYIVRLYGGIIELDSQLGKGSTFTIYLPVATSQ